MHIPSRPSCRGSRQLRHTCSSGAHSGHSHRGRRTVGTVGGVLPSSRSRTFADRPRRSSYRRDSHTRGAPARHGVRGNRSGNSRRYVLCTGCLTLGEAENKIYYPPEVSSMKYCSLGVFRKEYFRLITK